MPENQRFLEALKLSFRKCLSTSVRSNEKLKVLHSFVAKDLEASLADSAFQIYALGQEGKKGCEASIQGRYLNKKVDITVKDSQSALAGVAVKFVMSNYSQNSNNYFENMLGETANIRAAHIPYFQIFCIFDKIPYFDNAGIIKKWEKISRHNLDKYIKLSQDDIDCFYHTPDKTLLCIVHLSPDAESEEIKNKRDYENYYLNNDFSLTYSAEPFDFGKSVIYNDYKKYIEKITHRIKSL